LEKPPEWLGYCGTLVLKRCLVGPRRTALAPAVSLLTEPLSCCFPSQAPPDQLRYGHEKSTDWIDMPRYIVAEAGEIPEGKTKLVQVAGREIGVFNVGGKFFAIANRCPHEGASLCRGRMVGLMEADEPGRYRVSREGELVRCPWHGWEFDIRTGKSWCDPQRTKVRSFDVSVESEKIEGPYEIETYPVSVEKRYIVIDA
jgi:nitrite reductase/ring-hydroxylating ferredoxin subunit